MEISQPGCSNDIIDTDESPVGPTSWSYALKDEINTRESCQVKRTGQLKMPSRKTVPGQIQQEDWDPLMELYVL